MLRKNGKAKYRPSYSVLQDEFFTHMQEQGFAGFQRGESGSTSENLTSLQYQIAKDNERLSNIQKRIQEETVRYKSAHTIHKTVSEIEDMGKKTITGKIAVSKEDYQQLTVLAKEGITSRGEIHRLKENVSYYRERYYSSAITS